MSAQTSYNFHTAHGVAGGLFDISPYTSDSRNNEEADGKVKVDKQPEETEQGSDAGSEEQA